jgi:hypothetical protein
VQFSVSNQSFDAKIVFQEKCASLFELVSTGEVLIDELIRADAEMDDGVDD